MERFPRQRFQIKPIVSDPGMHHDTCFTHVPWCMSGSLTRGGGENLLGIPAFAHNMIQFYSLSSRILHEWTLYNYSRCILYFTCGGRYFYFAGDVHRSCPWGAMAGNIICIFITTRYSRRHTELNAHDYLNLNTFRTNRHKELSVAWVIQPREASALIPAKMVWAMPLSLIQHHKLC